MEYEKVVGRQLPDGWTLFRLKNGMTLRKGSKRRTRYQCECLDNGRSYSVSGVAEVLSGR